MAKSGLAHPLTGFGGLVTSSFHVFNYTTRRDWVLGMRPSYGQLSAMGVLTLNPPSVRTDPESSPTPLMRCKTSTFGHSAPVRRHTSRRMHNQGSFLFQGRSAAQYVASIPVPWGRLGRNNRDMSGKWDTPQAEDTSGRSGT
jgi:hypothetical protein